MKAAKKQPAAPNIEPMYLSREHAAAFVSLSESAWTALVSRGEAPAPRQLTAGRVGWLVEELIAWGKARPISTIAPPEGSGYGRAGKQA
ncbi:helix-turn-helix transcriptional regulator [Acidovorax sp. BL-A-41-H1]|uniref:helix-turn-helix transcriptional regulator n=1 Tax=Acidovorax sp. BL-A-41-H1 TaxID=3421102 RepID=UPI003F7A6AE1